MKAISATGVHFTYDDGTEALSGIDFHVEEGEFIAILGSNGSGKTTLINLLVGLIKARAGQIMIGGRAIGELSAEELYQRVGLVFQNPNDQLFAATVEEDCAFGPRNLNLPEAEVQQRVTEALSAVAALPLRAPTAYHLWRRAEGIFRTVYYLPTVTAGVAISLLWRLIFEPTYGLANSRT